MPRIHCLTCRKPSRGTRLLARPLATAWHARWQQRQIGFHQADIHPLLRQFWATLNLPADSEVLVPLCGKSKDMLWLHQQGHAVLGVELSEIALREFVDEHQLSAAR